MSDPTYTQKIPMFALRWFALYDNKPIAKGDGMLGKIFSDTTSDNLRRISLKSDAPSWLRDEYNSWRKYHSLDD